MEINDNCYTFKKLTYNNCLLNNVDATYIIHLKDNGRINDIYNQLKIYQPTKIVYIVYNKGFKNCEKPQFIKTAANDLFDVNVQIFKHSINMNYNNILLLEDDFIFSEKIKDSFHRNNIENFLQRKREQPFIYLIGCVPFLLIPHDYYNYKAIICSTTHSVIYNRKIINMLLNESQENIKNHDDFLMINYFNYKYTYYTPLCYQLFTETENQSNWGEGLSPILKIIPQIVILIFKKLKMDVQTEPGYSTFYFFSKFLWVIILLILLFLVYNTFLKKKSLKKSLKK